MISKVGLGFVFSILMLSGLVFAQGFQNVISTLKDVGVFQFYLPFLLVFAIIFGLLQKVEIFGPKGKPLNIIIGLAIAGFVMVYVPIGITFSQFLTNFAGNTVVVILTLIVAVVLISIATTGFGVKLADLGEPFKKGWGLIGLLLILLLIVFGVFIASGGTSIFPGIKISTKPAFQAIGGLSTTTWAIIILIVGTGLIVWIISKAGGAAGEETTGRRQGG